MDFGAALFSFLNKLHMPFVNSNSTILRCTTAPETPFFRLGIYPILNRGIHPWIHIAFQSKRLFLPWQWPEIPENDSNPPGILWFSCCWTFGTKNHPFRLTTFLIEHRLGQCLVWNFHDNVESTTNEVSSILSPTYSSGLFRILHR
jgi:hypothetical protein